MLIGALVQINLMTFTMIEVNIFLNIGPLLTVVLGGIFHPSERVTVQIIVKVLLAFTGVLLITLGAPNSDQILEIDGEQSDKFAIKAAWYNYIAMTTMPIALAFGNLAMGELRHLDPILISFYANACNLLLSITICLCNSKTGFYPLEASQTWSTDGGALRFFSVAILGVGGCAYLAWSLKVIGYRFDRVTRISPLFYLESAFALVFDITLFDV